MSALAMAESYRLADGFHPFLLALQVLARGDGECWVPSSRAALKRALLRPKDEALIHDKDLDATVRHAVALGLLSASSTPARLVITGGECA